MRKSLTTIALLHLCFLAMCQTVVAPTEGVTIPMDISSRRPVLSVTLDGEGPFTFIFDTGSSGHVIDQELARKLELNVIGEDQLGTPGSANRIKVDRVEVSNATIPGTAFSTRLELSAINLRQMLPVDGILNPSFFSGNLVTLDYPNSQMVISPGELPKGEDGVVPYQSGSRILSLPIEVAGIEIEAHLDSGNPGGFDLPFDLKEKLKFIQEPVEDGVINTPAASFKRWRGQLNGTIVLGDITYENPSVNLVEGFQFVNFGYAILKDVQTTIDQKNKLIRFSKSDNQNENTTGNNTQTKTNDFSGSYGGKVRKVFLENGEMYLQRGEAPKIKLVLIEGDLYKMDFGAPVANELPNVRFERNSEGKVTGLTFIYGDGRSEFVKKDSD